LGTDGLISRRIATIAKVLPLPHPEETQVALHAPASRIKTEPRGTGKASTRTVAELAIGQIEGAPGASSIGVDKGHILAFGTEGQGRA
jgi:hypothetical protein